MTDTETAAFFRRLCQICRDHDDWGMLWLLTDNETGEPIVAINCNDLFYWACADMEVITPDNIERLASTCAELKAIDEIMACHAPELFAARERKMRPQRPCYKRWQKWPKLIELFNACGPERDPKEEG